MTMTLRTLDVRLIEGASGGLHIPPLHVEGVTAWACAGKASREVASTRVTYAEDDAWSPTVAILVEEINFIQAGESLVRCMGADYSVDSICRRCSGRFRLTDLGE